MPVSHNHPRVRLASPTADAGDELPLRILVIGDAACRRLEAPLGERDPLPLGDGIGHALAALSPILAVDAADQPASGLRWTRAGGMSAGDIIAGVPALAAGWKRRQALLGAGGCDRAAADAEIALLGGWLATQVGTILRLPQVARCDALWRALSWLSTMAAAAQGVDLHLLPATREEIEEDLGDAPDPAASGLWRTIYDLEFGQHGGRPWSALLICGMPIAASARDLALLRRLAALGARAHAPVLIDAAPALLGLSAWDGLPTVVDAAGTVVGASAAWEAWRGGEDARHAVLALPAMRLRGAGETGGPLLGSAAAAVAAALIRCHDRTGWCADAAGWGPVNEVPAPILAGLPAVRGAEEQLPAACLLTDEQARNLASLGLAALCASRRRQTLSFPELPTQHRGEDGRCTPLPLVMIADRIAHHLKVLGRERLGGNCDRAEIERGLSAWLGRHVADGQVDDPHLRAGRPLRAASVRVDDVPGRAGWMRADFSVRPFLPGVSADVELALATRIDRGQR